MAALGSMSSVVESTTSLEGNSNQDKEIQCFSSSHSQGFRDEELGDSPGCWTTAVATYCQNRPLQLTQRNITKHNEQVDDKRCET